MDIEQDGDSVSASVSKEAAPDQQSLDKTHNQEFGLEAQGATTDTTEANEESELSSVVSGGCGMTKKKKKKNRRRRNKNRNRENISDNENSHGHLSKVVSNETLVGSPQEDKSTLPPTFVCSSSEVDKRKLTDDSVTMSTTLSTPETTQIQNFTETVIKEPMEKVSTNKIEETEIKSNQIEYKVDNISEFENTKVEENQIEHEQSSITSDSVFTDSKTMDDVASSVNVIFKVGAAVFENPSFTGQSEQGQDSVMNMDTSHDHDQIFPDVFQDERDDKKYQEPTHSSLGQPVVTNTPIDTEIQKLNTDLPRTDTVVLKPRKVVTFQDLDSRVDEDTKSRAHLWRSPPASVSYDDCDEDDDSIFEHHSQENLLNEDLASSSVHDSSYEEFERGLMVPTPSIENSAVWMDENLVRHPPLLHPDSLARMALLKREHPELVCTAQKIVENLIMETEQVMDDPKKLSTYDETLDMRDMRPIDEFSNSIEEKSIQSDHNVDTGHSEQVQFESCSEQLESSEGEKKRMTWLDPSSENQGQVERDPNCPIPSSDKDNVKEISQEKLEEILSEENQIEIKYQEECQYDHYEVDQETRYYQNGENQMDLDENEIEHKGQSRPISATSTQSNVSTHSEKNWDSSSSHPVSVISVIEADSNCINFIKGLTTASSKIFQNEEKEEDVGEKFEHSKFGLNPQSKYEPCPHDNHDTDDMMGHNSHPASGVEDELCTEEIEEEDDEERFDYYDNENNLTANTSTEDYVTADDTSFGRFELDLNSTDTLNFAEAQDWPDHSLSIGTDMNVDDTQKFVDDVDLNQSKISSILKFPSDQIETSKPEPLLTFENESKSPSATQTDNVQMEESNEINLHRSQDDMNNDGLSDKLKKESKMNFKSPQNDHDDLNKEEIKIVLSTDVSVLANLSTSTSFSSLDSNEVFKLPKVPNPSIENREGLQHLIVPSSEIGTHLDRLISESKNRTMNQKDAANESQQQLELESKFESSQTKMKNFEREDSEFNENSKLQILGPEKNNGCADSISETATNDMTLTLDLEKDTKEEQELIEKPRMRSSMSEIAENPQKWVIDPTVNKDALTEAEIEEMGRRGRSIMKNLWNCFGKRKKSVVTTEEKSEKCRTERSKFKSFTRSSLSRRK